MNAEDLRHLLNDHEDTPVTPPNDRVSSSSRKETPEVTPEERPLLPLVFRKKTKIAICEKKLKDKWVKLAAAQTRAQQPLVAEARAQQQDNAQQQLVAQGRAQQCRSIQETLQQTAV